MLHLRCCVIDNTPHKAKPDEALRSEIASAVSFIRRQMQVTKDARQTIPVHPSLSVNTYFVKYMDVDIKFRSLSIPYITMIQLVLPSCAGMANTKPSLSVSRACWISLPVRSMRPTCSCSYAG
jgi:hypothetical protein